MSEPNVTLISFIDTWNTVQGQSTPPLHAEIAQWLEDNWRNEQHELLLMAFRNAGKSTLVGLFAAWLLHADPTRRIIVLSADHGLARRMVRNTKRIIERHPWTGHLKPAHADEWASDRFTVVRERELRDPSVMAKGIGANITGSRADVVICDDVEVPNTCDTPGKREDLRERLDEIGYVLTPGGTSLFVGTPHTRDSVYGAAETSPDGTPPYLNGYQRLELPILDDAGYSRWPERFPLERIDAIRTRTGPAKFDSQMMLRPTMLAEGRLDPDRLVPYGAELDYREAGGEAVLKLGERRLVSASCWWDPAYGAPGRGDASVIAALFTDEDGNHRLHAIEYLCHDPAQLHIEDEATQQCRAVAAFLKRLHLPAVTIETNGIGRFLPGLLRTVLDAERLSAAIKPHHSSRAKDLRIVGEIDAPLAAGRLYAHESVLASPLIAEMRDWRPGGGANSAMRDDGLDALAGCLSSEPMRLPRNVDGPPPDRPPDWRRGARAYTANTDFKL